MLPKAATAETAEKSFVKPRQAIELGEEKQGRSPAHRIFDSIRTQIATVFPDDDVAAWTRTTENFEEILLERPPTEYSDWFKQRFNGSDEFSQLFTRRMFMVWDELENSGFIANEKELWEHQKALFAWACLNICSGSREEPASLLLRSPYGSGKSLVSGLIARAYRDAQLDMMMHGDIAPEEVPTGALIGMKKEHMIQNAVGQQFSVLQPPYNVERRDMNQYWRDFEARYGEEFSNLFPRPKKAASAFYGIFHTEEECSVREKIDAYLREHGARRTQQNAVMLCELEQLANGEIVFIPDEENIPQPHPAQLRDERIEGEDARFRGDSAHALEEGEHYHVKTSHRHLAPNPNTYSTKPDPEAQFAIVYGAALTKRNLRLDMEEFAKRCRLLLLDEAYKLNPGIIGDSVAQRSGSWPTVVGMTAQDMGIAGWEASPSISQAKMIELNLMKPVAYTTIGDPEHPPSAGSEEAWKVYEESLFEDYETAKALGAEQPHEFDTVTIVKPGRTHEYARRIREAHEKRGIPVEVYVYHSDAQDRKMSVLNAFKAPKAEGDPRRIMVATQDIAFAHTIPNAQCYDFVDDIPLIAKDQAVGRLGHVRNDAETEEGREVARTYVREQHLHKGKELHLRPISKKEGFTVPDEDATWVRLHNMIGYERDKKWEGLEEPVPIADTPKARRRKQRKKGKTPEFVGNPLEFTNPHAAKKERKRLERKRKRKERQEQELATGNAAPKPHNNNAKQASGSTQKEKRRQETLDPKYDESQHTPTLAMPGSPSKIAVMAYRFEQGLPLHHEHDCTGYADRGSCENVDKRPDDDDEKIV